MLKYFRIHYLRQFYPHIQLIRRLNQIVSLFHFLHQSNFSLLNLAKLYQQLFILSISTYFLIDYDLFDCIVQLYSSKIRWVIWVYLFLLFIQFPAFKWYFLHAHHFSEIQELHLLSFVSFLLNRRFLRYQQFFVCYLSSFLVCSILVSDIRVDHYHHICCIYKSCCLMDLLRFLHIRWKYI